MSEFISPEFMSELTGFISRHLMMCGAWIAVLVLLIVVQIRIMTAKVQKASSAIAIMMVNKQEGLFVDVRPADRFGQGHIAHAVNVTSADIKEGRFQRIERYKDKPVILVGKDKFDSDCFNSARTLKKSGYSNVFILEGGIAEWSNQNLPLSTKK